MASRHAKPQATNTKTMDKTNILLVDDHPGKLKSYQAILEDLGENLVLARSGREALQTLLKNDLIDEYRLFIFPLVLGSGKRLFAGGTVPAALKQLESVTSEKGATYHRFERSGKPQYGQMGA